MSISEKLLFDEINIVSLLTLVLTLVVQEHIYIAGFAFDCNSKIIDFTRKSVHRYRVDEPSMRQSLR